MEVAAVAIAIVIIGVVVIEGWGDGNQDGKDSGGQLLSSRERAFGEPSSEPMGRRAAADVDGVGWPNLEYLRLGGSGQMNSEGCPDQIAAFGDRAKRATGGCSGLENIIGLEDRDLVEFVFLRDFDLAQGDMDSFDALGIKGIRPVRPEGFECNTRGNEVGVRFLGPV